MIIKKNVITPKASQADQKLIKTNKIIEAIIKTTFEAGPNPLILLFFLLPLAISESSFFFAHVAQSIQSVAHDNLANSLILIPALAILHHFRLVPQVLTLIH